MTYFTQCITALMVFITLIPAQAKQVTLDVSLSRPTLIANQKQIAYIKIGLTGFEPAKNTERAPVNIALVIDESGSMSGDKIEKAKEAAIMAISRLAPRDIVSVISYDSTVNVLVPATKVSERAAIIANIRRLEAGGSTALYAGTSRGHAEVKKFLNRNRVNRVILISDGQANIGPSSPGALADLGRVIAKSGISVSTVGLGLGYNEDLMTQLAAASDGNHAFAQSATDLVAIFDREFNDVLSVVAQEVEITIRCKAGIRPIRALGRDATIVGQTVTANLKQIYANQEKYLLMEVEIPASQADTTRSVADVGVSYANMETKVMDKIASNVGVTFTGSKVSSKASENKDVMVAVVSQVANDNNVLALNLRDKGKIEEAKQVLINNSAYINDYNDDLDSAELDDLQSLNIQQAEKLDSSNWAQNRKSMRYNQYIIEKQQRK